MRSFFITGYKRTGKDSFFRYLVEDETTFEYQLYSQPNYEIFLPFQLQRYAFADALKQEVRETFGVTVTDHNKELPLTSSLPSIKTYRDLLKYWGNVRKSEDPHYWIKRLCDNIEHDNVVITDWRYPEELEEFVALVKPRSVCTMRLFRCGVPIPPYDDESEHSLDHIGTDILVVNNKQDFLWAQKMFPKVYDDFVPNNIMRGCYRAW